MNYPESCFEDIICPACREHSTRHDPCCAGAPQCDCMECETCGELVPELNDGGLCEPCALAPVLDCCQICRKPLGPRDGEQHFDADGRPRAWAHTACVEAKVGAQS